MERQHAYVAMVLKNIQIVYPIIDSIDTCAALVATKVLDSKNNDLRSINSVF